MVSQSLVLCHAGWDPIFLRGHCHADQAFVSRCGHNGICSVPCMLELRCAFLEFTTRLSYHDATYPLRERLKSYIYGLTKGKVMYQSVVHSLFKNKSQYTELNRTGNL
jgi:hypothetical protein